MSNFSSIRLGSAPDSWGVWFGDNPLQVSWRTFLAEVSGSGYEWIELGPYGYLPTDPAQLGDELAAHGLSLSAGTVFEQLHRPDSYSAVWQQVSDVAALTKAVGGSHVVVIPEMWRDQGTGEIVEDRELTDDAWQRKIAGIDRLGRQIQETYGLGIQYHPHADSHVGTQLEVIRFLESTDPEYVNLCLDTGHIAYCGGDNLAIIAAHPERIGYLHLKQVDPAVLAQVQREDLSFSEAVKRGVMIEPPTGAPALPPVLDAVAELGIDIFAIVEQDLYPCSPEVPLPIARRTHRYLSDCGLGAGTTR